MHAPNLVIAGTVKGGTTSLFRYLAIHPDICASKIKETCYFLPIRYGKNTSSWGDYLKMFDHYSGQPFILEATPGYFEGGASLAKELKSRLGDDIRIILTFRNPSERLISFFNYKKAQLQLPTNMNIKSYISKCTEMPMHEKLLEENDAYWGVEGGRYMQYLPQWFEIFSANNIKIIFFDDIANNPSSVMEDLCSWIGINSNCYHNTVFTAENKTVQYRNAFLQKIAIIANRKLEPLLNNSPRVRQLAREVYWSLNGKKKGLITDQDIKLIDALYQADNHELEIFLKSIGFDNLPKWINQTISIENNLASSVQTL